MDEGLTLQSAAATLLAEGFVGASADRLRKWQGREKLLDPPTGTRGTWTAADLERAREVLALEALGFLPKEIRTLKEFRELASDVKAGRLKANDRIRKDLSEALGDFAGGPEGPLLVAARRLLHQTSAAAWTLKRAYEAVQGGLTLLAAALQKTASAGGARKAPAAQGALYNLEFAQRRLASAYQRFLQAVVGFRNPFLAERAVMGRPQRRRPPRRPPNPPGGGAVP